MRKIVFFLSVFFVSLSLIAGSITVVGAGTSSTAKKIFKNDEGVKVILKGGKYFVVEKFLGEKGDFYLFQKNGNKVAFPKSQVEEIKLHIEVEGSERDTAKKETIKKEPKNQNGKKLILTDYNIERHYFPKQSNQEEEQTEEKKSAGLSIRVLNQVIQRKGDTITFKADIKNVTGFEVGKLSIILRIYDSKGKLVEKKKIFLANSLKNGKSVPFTYSMKDPKGTITRFDYSFEGVVYKPVKKEE